MRRLLLIAAVLLPQFLKQAFYRRCFGWKIGRGVKIGWSYLDARKVEIGDNVQIGHFNLLRKVALFQVGSHSTIANFNQFFGVSVPDPRYASELILGERVSFMSHHFIDVTGTIIIGSRSVIAGRDSQFWSHTLRPTADSRDYETLCLRLGEDVYIGARSTLVSGSIPDGAIVGAGSVVTKHFEPSADRLLIAGNPATIKKRYSATPASELVPSHPL